MWKRGWIRAAQFLSTQQSLTPFLSLFCSIWGGRSSCVWVWEQDNLAMTLRCQKTVLPLTPTLRDSVWGIDLHFHVKMHMFLAPHDCTSAGSHPEREGGLEVCCVFLALGHCRGCPRSTMFRQADCFWGQGREWQCFWLLTQAKFQGVKGGQMHKHQVLGVLNRNTSSSRHGLTKKLSCFFHAMDDTDNDNNMLFYSGNLSFFLSTSQINQCAKSVCESEQRGSEKGRRKAAM